MFILFIFIIGDFDMEKIQIRKDGEDFIITNENGVKLVIKKAFITTLNELFKEKDVVNLNWNGKNKLTLSKE
jgi:hypothetical protein